MPALRPALALACFLVAGRGLAADFPAFEALPVRTDLPDPLVGLDGKAVTTPEAWARQRRPELLRLFAHYMYGRAPEVTAAGTARVVREDKGFLDGKATLKEVTLSYGPAGTPPMHLLLVVPNGGSGPAPVFLGPNFYGNHAVTADPRVALPAGWVPARGSAAENRATEAGRGAQAEAWAVDAVIDRGFALATFYSGDVAPDRPGHADGVHPHYPGYDWGTIAAWAWGLSRAADYLVSDPALDGRKITVLGHSRMGKAALLAGARDERFAAVIALQAGCGGSAPSRGKIGESVEKINTAFPHWFNAEFKKFNQEPERLPFDQNGLVALVAPRPLLFANATEDTWANPEGQFQVLKAAGPVYRLLGATGVGEGPIPEVNRLVGGTLGYVIRPGKHSMTREDWGYFFTFVEKQLGRARP